MKSLHLSIARMFRSLAAAAIAFVIIGAALPARAQINTLATLPSLTTYASLLPQPSGKFFGVDNEGGLAFCNLGCGGVFELLPESGGTWRKNYLHVFTGPDGVWPSAGLILDSAGNLYGTAFYGGATYGGACGGNGCGVVFRLSPAAHGWDLTILHSFTGGADGSNPTTLAFGASGSLIGITRGGGGSPQCSIGCGVVFQLARNSSGGWQESRLFNFPGGYTGQYPVGLLLDASGNLYGAASGGNNTCYAGYCGLIFKLAHSSAGWKESVMYRFHGSDGALPNPSLIFDSAGRIYGSTAEGGRDCNAVGCGTVFQLSLKNGVWSESVIHGFTDQADGFMPVDGLAFDAQGNLYGGTQGANSLVQCNPFIFGACGQIFKLTPHSGTWEVAAEYATPGFITPVGNLLVDSSNNIYASAADQVYFNGGVVFEIIQ